MKADLFIDDRNVGGLPDWGTIYRMIKEKKSMAQLLQEEWEEDQPVTQRRKEMVVLTTISFLSMPYIYKGINPYHRNGPHGGNDCFRAGTSTYQCASPYRSLRNYHNRHSYRKNRSGRNGHNYRNRSNNHTCAVASPPR